MYPFHQRIPSKKSMLGTNSGVGPRSYTMRKLQGSIGEFVWGLRGERRDELSSCKRTDELSTQLFVAPLQCLICDSDLSSKHGCYSAMVG